jgi:hypothetical protein
MRPIHMLALLVAVVAAGTAAAQAPRAVAKPAMTRVPVTTAGRSTPSPAIIVQGGITPQPGCSPQASVAGSTPSSAIGPKQDDPANPHPGIAAASVASSTRAVAIGPKQDDPSPPPPAAAATMKCTPTAH